MLQTWIAERFGMRFHREMRDFNVFALVVAKGGPHLKAAEQDTNSARAGARRPNPRRCQRRSRRRP